MQNDVSLETPIWRLWTSLRIHCLFSFPIYIKKLRFWKLHYSEFLSLFDELDFTLWFQSFCSIFVNTTAFWLWSYLYQAYIPAPAIPHAAIDCGVKIFLPKSCIFFNNNRYSIRIWSYLTSKSSQVYRPKFESKQIHTYI